MNTFLTFFLTSVLTVSSIITIHAQGLKMGGGSKVWIDGTSTLHDWQCTCKGVTGSFSIPETIFSAKAGDEIDLKTTITVPVKQIYNEKEDLVENLQEAMDADKYGTIKYIATSASIVSSDATKAILKTTGKLTIHGIEKTISFMVNITKSANGMDVKGVANINMKDHGIDPPTMMLGTIKTGKDVKIGFDLDLIK